MGIAPAQPVGAVIAGIAASARERAGGIHRDTSGYEATSYRRLRAAAARLTVEKLRQALSDVVPAHGWRITASIGVATFLVPPESVDALLAAADRLMYQAKQSGKNTISHETQNEAPVVR